MLTRRDLLVGAGAAFSARAEPRTGVNFGVPANACDCHTHIFGDPKRFPMWSGRVYTPETALPEEMSALHRALHVSRVVIVTPSIYGTDNAATLYGMQARGANARGIAVIDGQTSDGALDTMGRAGVGGIRLNLATGGQTDPTRGRLLFQAAVDRLKGRNWHIQIYTDPAAISVMKDLIQASPVPVVFDHFGGAHAALGLEQPGFADLVELVHSGAAFVKISGAYRASTEAPDYPDVTPFAKALIAANPDRILWGTDWPHPNTMPTRGVTPFLKIDDGRLMNQLAVWAPEPAMGRKILVENPARLYGF